jgi:hypothetical protein
MPGAKMLIDDEVVETVEIVENGGKWWKMVENGGKWWKMLENVGKCWKNG